MSEHSILSPSSAHRRVRCPGSLAACKGITGETSEYAAEGTAYHEVAADVLAAPEDWSRNCADWIGQEIEIDGFKFIIDAENAAYAQVYVDAIRRIPGALLVEVRLDTSSVVGVDGQGGTGDAIVLDYEHHIIHVNDLKFGRGEIVYANGNEQMLEYGAAALHMFQDVGEWAFVKVAIHQPRVDHYDEKLYSIRELEDWVHAHRPLEQRAFELYEHGTPEQIRAALVPGDKQCRWCPIKGSCAARSEAMLVQFPVIGAPVNIEMTDAEIGAARDRVDDIERWCSEIQAESLRRALVGRAIPGWKLVAGRAGARKWADDQMNRVEGCLKTVLGDGAYKPSVLISPADAEKKLKKIPETWALVLPAITQADGTKALARLDDRRDALVVSTVEFNVTPEPR
jgi:hypothetical protein